MNNKDQGNLYYCIGVHLLSLVLAVLSGCATSGKSVGLGGVIGGSTGAVLGGLADPGKDGKYRTRNIVIGTALGGMAGMATGALLYQSGKEDREEAFQKGKASAPVPQGSMPRLQDPKVEAHWIESRTVGNRYIEGHFEYVISEPARWDGGQ